MEHVWYREQFVVGPHNKTNPHDIHTILPCGARLLSCGAKLLHMKISAPRTMSAASATNMMYAFQMHRPTIKNLLVYFLLSVSLMFLVGLLQADSTIFSRKTSYKVRMILDFFKSIYECLSLYNF